MNLLLVSEKHGLLIVGVKHELFVYPMDPVRCIINDVKDFKRIGLSNEEVTFIFQFLRTLLIT